MPISDDTEVFLTRVEHRSRSRRSDDAAASRRRIVRARFRGELHGPYEHGARQRQVHETVPRCRREMQQPHGHHHEPAVARLHADAQQQKQQTDVDARQQRTIAVKQTGGRFTRTSQETTAASRKATQSTLAQNMAQHNTTPVRARLVVIQSATIRMQRTRRSI